ncbi:MAG: hypothetical protein L0Z55_07720, partial [Planctomycetes bacterium]|nr:hypothetical protein [Planctomycetota bacterium]
KRYKILDRVTREFTAQDVEVITYVDRPPAEEKPKDPPPAGAGPTPTPEKKEGGEKPKEPPPPPKKHRAYVFPHVDKAFVVVGSANEADFSRHEADFLRAAESFRIELKNRW